MQIDSIGGEIFSGTNRDMQNSGTVAVTATNGREDMTLDAVFVDDNGAYQQNTSSISTQQYWETVALTTGNLGIGEANIYDATNVRLRSLSLSYAFDKDMIGNTLLKVLNLVSL